MDSDTQWELIREVRALQRQLSWIAGLLTLALCVGLFFLAGDLAHTALLSFGVQYSGGWIEAVFATASALFFWWYLTALRERG